MCGEGEVMSGEGFVEGTRLSLATLQLHSHHHLKRDNLPPSLLIFG
jgi:hypothetical protein